MTTHPDKLSNQDLWSFIKNQRATKSASLKVLQKFVLSLNENELRHLIESYFKLKLSAHDFGGLTLKNSFNTLVNNNNNNDCSPCIDDINDINEIDQGILHKMNKKYGKKYNKKIIKQIQQTHSANNILSIPPQVLAYSFQYLSFQQLYKIQTVCSYFTYLTAKYRNLCHYFIALDCKFWPKAMRQQINLQRLTHFKHIKIASAYQGRICDDKTVFYRTELFKYILNFTLKNSFSCLNTLEIDIPIKDTHGYYHEFTLLNHVLDTFNPLPINTLIWKKDTFHRLGQEKISPMFKMIQQKIITNCPHLQHLNFGLNDFRYSPLWRRTNSVYYNVGVYKDLRTYLVGPTLSVYQFQDLKSLELYCPSWNIFKTYAYDDDQLQYKYNIIELIVNLKNLQKLSITCCINAEDKIDINKNIKSISVQELKTEFVVDINENHRLPLVRVKLQYILFKLFSSFIGIQHFEFGFSLQKRWGISLPLIKFAIDWQMLFAELFRHKRMYSMDSNSTYSSHCQCVSISYLESLKFNQISLNDGKSVLNDLQLLKDEIYFDLKQFSMNIVGDSIMEISHDQFEKFMNDGFIPFTLQYQNGSRLQTLNLSYGDRNRIHPYYYHLNRRVNVCIQESYFEPILNLLSILPKSLISLSLKPPNYCILNKEENRKIKEIESTKLVQKLCSMISGNESILKSIVLDHIALSSKPKQFLTFMFGFNNKFCDENAKYYLHF